MCIQSSQVEVPAKWYNWGVASKICRNFSVPFQEWQRPEVPYIPCDLACVTEENYGLTCVHRCCGGTELRNLKSSYLNANFITRLNYNWIRILFRCWLSVEVWGAWGALASVG